MVATSHINYRYDKTQWEEEELRDFLEDYIGATKSFSAAQRVCRRYGRVLPWSMAE